MFELSGLYGIFPQALEFKVRVGWDDGSAQGLVDEQRPTSTRSLAAFDGPCRRRQFTPL